MFPAWGQCSDARYADGYLCYNGNLGLCWALWAQPTRGLVLSNDGHDFNPDVGVLASGLVRVVSARTAGEGPGDLRTYDINPVTGAVNGVVQPWVDLTAKPTPPIPPEPPIPPIPPIPPQPPKDQTIMVTCALHTMSSNTYWVAEMNLPVPTFNARTTDPNGPWQTFDLIGWDKNAKGQYVSAVIRCHGTNKYLAINASGDPVALPDVPHVFQVTSNANQFGFYAVGFGWLVIEQGPGDGPTYRMTVRAKDDTSLTAWTTFQATDSTGKVLPNPF